MFGFGCCILWFVNTAVWMPAAENSSEPLRQSRARAVFDDRLDHILRAGGPKPAGIAEPTGRITLVKPHGPDQKGFHSEEEFDPRGRPPSEEPRLSKMASGSGLKLPGRTKGPNIGRSEVRVISLVSAESVVNIDCPKQRT